MSKYALKVGIRLPKRVTILIGALSGTSFNFSSSSFFVIFIGIKVYESFVLKGCVLGEKINVLLCVFEINPFRTLDLLEVNFLHWATPPLVFFSFFASLAVSLIVGLCVIIVQIVRVERTLAEIL